MKMRAEGQIARGGVERESTSQGPASEMQSEQYSREDPGHLGARNPSDGRPWLGRFLPAGNRFRGRPPRAGVARLVLLTLGLV
jgi:hypothetical protein